MDLNFFLPPDSLLFSLYLNYCLLEDLCLSSEMSPIFSCHLVFMTVQIDVFLLNLHFAIADFFSPPFHLTRLSHEAGKE